MNPRDELLKLLKPISKMREEQFGYADDLGIVYQVEDSAEKIDYLLSATLGAYRYVIEKHYRAGNDDLSDEISLTKNPGERIDFYGDFHCWKMCELINKMTFESKRTGTKLRSSLIREMLIKQLELYRLMTKYSDPGDIWGRASNAAISLAELIETENFPGQNLTIIAEWECLFSSEKDAFSFPRYSKHYFDRQTQIMVERLGLGIQTFLISEGFNSENAQNRTLRAIIDEEQDSIITISYETEVGTYYRDAGYWWEFLEDAEEYFESYELAFVYPQFIELYDRQSELSPISTEQMLPFIIPGDVPWE